MKKSTKNGKVLKEMGVSFATFTPTETSKIFKIVICGAKLKSSAYKTFFRPFTHAHIQDFLKYLLKYRINDFSLDQLNILTENIEVIKEEKKKSYQETLQKKILDLQKELEALV